MPLHSIRVVGSPADGKAMGILFARQVWHPAWPSDLSDCGHDRDIAHRRKSGMEQEQRVILTSDEDFGELVFREGLNSHGVVPLRLDELPVPAILARLQAVWSVVEANPARRFIVAVARRLIPRLRRIRFRKARVYQTESELVRFGRDTLNRSIRRPYQGKLILFDFEHAENVSARTASEGTILILGLLTVLLGPTRPRILLLDDIDHGLHPLAQK